MTRRVLISPLIVASLLLSGRAQQPRSSQSQSQQQPARPRPQPDTTQEADDIVRITTNLVQVDVVVTKDGKVVTELNSEDFELFQDGKQQTISHFAYVSNVSGESTISRRPEGNTRPATPQPGDLRRTVALVVDDLGISFESMAVLRQQLRKFLNEQIQPNDLVAIIRTSGDVGALQQFTTDRRLLEGAFDHLRWNPCSRGGLGFASAMSPLMCGDVGGSSSSLNSTLRSLRFLLQGMRDLPGRKSMVIFTDDLPVQVRDPEPLTNPYRVLERTDLGNLKPLDKTMTAGDLLPSNNSILDDSNNQTLLFERISELAIRASVVIYAVDTRGMQYTGITAADGNLYRSSIPDPASVNVSSSNGGLHMPDMQSRIAAGRSAELRNGRTGAQFISGRTGGFMVFNSNDFGLARIMNDQNGYYLLGYRPADQTFDGRFHRLTVRVKGRGLAARTRSGFYGVRDEDARPSETTALDQINRALVSPFGVNEITVNLSTLFVNDSAAGPLLRSFLFLDSRALTFNEAADGTHEASFDLSGVLFGDNGRIIRRQDQTATLRLKGKPYDRALREGFVYPFDLPIHQSGTLQFRIAVRDKASSRIGSAGQIIEIPNLANNRLALSGILVRDEADLPSPDKVSSPGDDALIRGPAVRRFHQGSTLNFAYEVYNAHIDPNTRQGHLTAQLRLFHDGKPIYEGSSRSIDLAGLKDIQRIGDNARLQLGAGFPEGEYVVVITVQDQFAKEKQHSATQWIDFKVVK